MCLRYSCLSCYFSTWYSGKAKRDKKEHNLVSKFKPGLCLVGRYCSHLVFITSEGWQSLPSRNRVAGQNGLVLLILREAQTSSLEDTMMHSDLLQATGREFQSRKFTQVLRSPTLHQWYPLLLLNMMSRGREKPWPCKLPGRGQKGWLGHTCQLRMAKP